VHLYSFHYQERPVSSWSRVHFVIGLISHDQLIGDDDVDSSILNKTKKYDFMVPQSSRAEADASVRLPTKITYIWPILQYTQSFSVCSLKHRRCWWEIRWTHCSSILQIEYWPLLCIDVSGVWALRIWGCQLRIVPMHCFLMFYCLVGGSVFSIFLSFVAVIWFEKRLLDWKGLVSLSCASSSERSIIFWKVVFLHLYSERI